jgi:hypothetical protein
MTEHCFIGFFFFWYCFFPICQVSLLIILNEVQAEQGEDVEDVSALNIGACVERVTQAVDGFIKVGQDQIHHSSDPVRHLDHQFASILGWCSNN